MFKFILFLFLFFALLIALLGFSLIRSVKNIFFGNGDKSATTQQHRSPSGGKQQKREYSQHRSSDMSSSSPKKKIIDKNEGEYVDYEEVKE